MDNNNRNIQITKFVLAGFTDRYSRFRIPLAAPGFWTSHSRPNIYINSVGTMKGRSWTSYLSTRVNFLKEILTHESGDCFLLAQYICMSVAREGGILNKWNPDEIINATILLRACEVEWRASGESWRVKVQKVK